VSESQVERGVSAFYPIAGAIGVTRRMSASGDSSEPTRIMIVEDERIVALDIERHVERFGYRVPATFASAEEALGRLQEIAPDLVLMDIQLQGELDGVEAGRIFQEEHGIPVILITAYADEATLERAKLTKPLAYIVKPFEAHELKTAIVMSLHRHEIERKLAYREQLLFTSLRSIDDAVVVTDLDDRVEFINRAAERLVEITAAETIRRSFEEVFPVAPGTEDVPEALRRRHDVGLLDVGEHQAIPVEHRSVPLRDEREERTGTVHVLRDLGEQIEAERRIEEQEQQLRYAQKMEAVGRFSGGLAHDFNNLLTIIMGYTKLLEQMLENYGGHVDLEEFRANVEGINKAAKRSASLTRRLLAFSRRQVLHPDVVDLNDIVSESEGMLRRLLGERITMHLSLAQEPLRAYVDAGQIEHVLMNLVVNARDAMPEGGTVMIDTTLVQSSDSIVSATGRLPPGEYGCIRVKDTGHGIPDGHIGRVFEPFFTTKEKVQGTGLGLASAYGIVKQSGGLIRVGSVDGQGSTFEMLLPKTAESEPRRRHEVQRHESLRGAERVLVAGEDQAMRGFLTKALLQHGYRVLEVQNVAEAVVVAEESATPIDAIVTDMTLPYVEPRRVTARLVDARPGIKVLLLCGEQTDSAKDSCGPDSAIRLLRKPFDAEDFLRELRGLCST